MEPSREAGALESFWRAATTICTQVALQQPDLTVGLLRKGWAPLAAARVLWEYVCTTPFPPALPINFGVEKQHCRITQSVFDGWFATYEEEGWLLAWLTRQHDWQQELREMVATTIGSQAAPRRVLIVDEFIYSGTTRTATLGLFLATFPRVQSRFLGWMAPNWPYPMVQSWMERHHPDLLNRMRVELGFGGTKKLPPPLGELGSGVEDVEPASLRWQRLNPQGELMSLLTEFMPYEAWLECPAWIEGSIAAHIRQQADVTGWTLARGKAEHGQQPFGDQLSHRSLVWRELHLHGQITYREASRILDIPAKESRYFLDRLARRGELYQIGGEPMPHYTVAPQEIIDRLKWRRKTNKSLVLVFK